MCESQAFEASPVKHPLIDLAALLALHTLVSCRLNSLRAPTHGADEEETRHETVGSISAGERNRKAASTGRSTGDRKSARGTAGRSAREGDTRAVKGGRSPA